MTTDAPHATIGRRMAVPMIGLGAACCSSVEFVKLNWPDLAAFPGAAGSICAMLGVLLLFRSQLRAAKAARANRDGCIRISPYVPEMADGSNGAETLKIILTPSPQVVVSTAFSIDAPHAPETQEQGPAEETKPERPFAHAKRLVSRPLATAQEIGAEWSQDVQLSGRAQERLEADPFVRRLARLG
ncbi:hypothetical protein [Aliiruegeria lutimaris]|uniref:Uncharacterized protein n=1 Tax=Aliiruegeria lutimaris TaxID=571298 RepID=A0A1G8V246_9RHOB|nr:hypothetical protein [Aliiruegeria lutimaris]SDJ60138.1 hypothetical protein SAMN04488026_102057 [Aliiruegeria lutimaris]